MSSGGSRRGAARRAPQRSRGRGRSRIVDPARAAASAVAIVCAVGLLLVAFGELAPIRGVEVVAARHLRTDVVVEQSGLRGVPVFLASALEARRALLQLPAVKDARVELAVPEAARVTLVEREAAGRWIVGTLEWFVDDDGALFASIDPRAAPDLRVHDERVAQRSAGERLDPALVAAAVRLAKIAPGELRTDASAPRVRVTSGPDGLILESGARWQIRFGDAQRIEEKLALARRFLRENAQRPLDYVDVRSPDRIVFSPQ